MRNVHGSLTPFVVALSPMSLESTVDDRASSNPCNATSILLDSMGLDPSPHVQTVPQLERFVQIEPVFLLKCCIKRKKRGRLHVSRIKRKKRNHRVAFLHTRPRPNPLTENRTRLPIVQDTDFIKLNILRNTSDVFAYTRFLNERLGCHACGISVKERSGSAHQQNPLTHTPSTTQQARVHLRSC